MLEELNVLIAYRIKEVLQYHLNGKPEDFEAASQSVMDELSSMGANLQGIVATSSLSMETPLEREKLAKQLAAAFTDTVSED